MKTMRVIIVFIVSMIMAQQALGSGLGFDPSPEQIEKFMQLPQGQQEALAKKYGVDLKAIAANPTAEQIDMFRRLPPAQQEVLARKYGLDLDALQQGTLSEQNSPSLNELVRERGEVVNTDVSSEFQRKDYKSKYSASTLGSDTNSSQDKAESTLEQALKPFGYELFAGEPSTFAPISDVPVPSEYILGPGDTIRVQFYGKESQDYSLSVNRQGDIEIPKLGPFSVVGKSFMVVRDELKKEISNRIIGVQSNISMGELRSIRVFVLGDAYKPASYTISSLSTVTQAIFAAGGISDIGSLRNIEVKRKGKVVATLDLYDLLLKGDTRGDITLIAGDVVFVPPRGKTVAVKGAVTRPAIYELKQENTVSDAINLAGGLLPSAFTEKAKLERMTKQGLRQVLDADLNKSAEQKIISGDVIEVSAALKTVEQSVTLFGHVSRPGVYGWTAGMRLSKLLGNIHDFRTQPDLSYILITREDPLTGAINAFDVDYAGYLRDNNSAADFELKARDRIYVFDREPERAKYLSPVIAQLEKQTMLAELAKVVSIVGAVRNPGQYPLTENATVNNLLRAAMGYTQQAEIDFILIARLNQESWKTELQYVDLNNEQQIRLQPLDKLFVFYKDESREALIGDLINELSQQATKGFSSQLVSIQGDVRFPGVYPYVKGMTKAMLIKLAGDLNASSYMVDAELSRFKTNEKTDAALEHSVIPLDKKLALQPLDTLFIKRIPEWRKRRTVTLKGEVKFPGSYVLHDGERLSAVIKRAGGLTEQAYAEGAIFTRESLKIKEQEQITRLAKELEAELATLSVDKSDDARKVSIAETERLKDRLESTAAIGRLVIDLPMLLAKNDKFDITLDAGDSLFIPKISESIAVLGEVQYPTSHIFDSRVDIEEYIERSGGLRVRADDERIYIVRANGGVYRPNKSSWYSLDKKLSPGDTIVVPLDTEYRDSLSLWNSATDILYNTAIAVAALNGL